MTNLHRFFIPKDEIYAGIFKTHDGNTVDKARKVLRLRIGDKVRIFDGEGNEYVAQIDLLRKNVFGGIIQEEAEKQEVSKGPRILLAQALTQAKKLDLIIKMNTELGVNSFVFFESDHSKVKLADLKKTKLERWEKIAQEASRQSEQLQVPTFREPTHFDEIINWKSDLMLILHSKDDLQSVDITSIVEKVSEDMDILVIIGPEGGFSDSEISKASEKAISVVHMGLPVLRTETASIVVNSYLLLNK